MLKKIKHKIYHWFFGRYLEHFAPHLNAPCPVCGKKLDVPLHQSYMIIKCNYCNSDIHVYGVSFCDVDQKRCRERYNTITGILEYLNKNAKGD